MLRCGIYDVSRNQAKSPDRNAAGVVRQNILGLVLVPFFIVGCARLKPAPTSPEPSGTAAVAPAKGSAAESSSTPQAERPVDTPPPAQSDLRRPSPAHAAAAVTAAGTQAEAKKDRPPASTAKGPGVDQAADLLGGSAGPAAKQARPAKILDAPVQKQIEKPQAAPTLDLASLEQRLRDTRAIGVFTKLSLKNQVDDLLEQFRAYHKKEAQISLTELRQRYDLLLLKVLSLLQDNDAPLAVAISSSREAIWQILTDPGKFAKIDVQ